MLEVTLALLAIAFVLAYFYFTRTFNYWRDKGVVFVKPYPLIGSMWRQITVQEHVLELFRRIYFNYPDHPYVGFYQGLVPTLLIRDPELIKNIIVKDFSHFTDHGLKFSEEADPLLTRNLFNLNGQSWKKMRAKLTPVFTSGRMKAMFPMALQCALNLEAFLENIADSTGDIELKDILARYTTDVIGSNVFGIAIDSLNDPNNKFRLMSKKLLETDAIQGMKLAIGIYIPGMADVIKATFFKPECEVYFRALINDLITSRAASGEKKKDFLQLLIELNEKGCLNNEDDQPNEIGAPENNGAMNERLTDSELIAQASIFFFAGFETSSSALSCGLYELARRPDIQRTAREHIEEVLQRHNGELTYQAVQDMTYLDWIIQETLRKYPTLTIFRKCTKKYTIPGTDVTIEEGTPVVIPNFGLHYDPKFFHDPEEFIPERFSDTEMLKKNQYIYLPFGEGPRLCIGKRFAYMQSKLGLLMFLRKFEVQANAKTATELIWDPRLFLLATKHDIFAKIVRI